MRREYRKWGSLHLCWYTAKSCSSVTPWPCLLFTKSKTAIMADISSSRTPFAYEISFTNTASKLPRFQSSARVQGSARAATATRAVQLWITSGQNAAEQPHGDTRPNDATITRVTIEVTTFDPDTNKKYACGTTTTDVATSSNGSGNSLVECSITSNSNFKRNENAWNKWNRYSKSVWRELSRAISVDVDHHATNYCPDKAMSEVSLS